MNETDSPDVAVPAELLIVAATGVSGLLVLVPPVWETPLRLPVVVGLLGVAPGYALVAALDPPTRSGIHGTAEARPGTVRGPTGKTTGAATGETESDAGGSTDAERASGPGHGSDPERATHDGGVERGFHSIERIGFAVAGSVLAVALAGVGLAVAGVGIRTAPLVLTLGGITVALSVVATRRWRALPPAKRSPTRPLRRLRERPSAAPDDGVGLALPVAVAVVLIVGGSAAYATTAPNAPGETGAAASPLGALAPPGQSPQFTEFSLLAENGSGDPVASGYPTDLVAGENRSLVVGVRNHEGSRTPYEVVVRVDRLAADQNGTTVPGPVLRRFSATLDPNETWRRRHAVSPGTTGERLRLTYLLYRGSAPSDPSVRSAYRHLTLRVSVAAENAAAARRHAPAPAG